MPEHLLIYILTKYGLTGGMVVLGVLMAAAAWAQIVQLRRWQPQTVEIVRLLRENVVVAKQIVVKLDSQHTACTRHYAVAHEQISGMASIGHELEAVVKTITESDRARTAEIMQLMTIIASRKA